MYQQLNELLSKCTEVRKDKKVSMQIVLGSEN